MPKYYCDDGTYEIEIEADTPKKAAKKYVDGGDWGESDTTRWISVHVWMDKDDDGEWITITVDPPEPECVDGHEHDWRSPYSVLGGLKENPGCWSHGGGVIYTEVCQYCGRYRETDTWAQNRENGEQGLTSIKYRESDEASEAYVLRRARRAVESITIKYDPDDYPSLSDKALRRCLPDEYDVEIGIALIPEICILGIEINSEGLIEPVEEEIEDIISRL